MSSLPDGTKGSPSLSRKRREKAKRTRGHASPSARIDIRPDRGKRRFSLDVVFAGYLRDVPFELDILDG